MPTAAQKSPPRERVIRADFASVVTEELREAYLSDPRPWVLGFSGGKDSTCLLQFTYYMLLSLGPGGARKPVYVVGSDTRVEAPNISARIGRELGLVAAAAARDRLPVVTEVVSPRLNDTFWVNLIGRGYPSPSNHFRWCTERLKIAPISAFIRRVVKASGKVVVVLGARKSESATRAQTMAANSIVGQRYRPHAQLPGAWVYTPIEDLSADEVWTYLVQVPSPWGGDNDGLRILYKQASGGECPLVIDHSTPSCGQSRFGCWTCTVVERDRSMEFLVDSGEDRYEPLLRFRDRLKEIRSAPGARSDLRRNGRAAISRSGEVMSGTGPFTPETRAQLLRELLLAQRESGLQLIGNDELSAIELVWRAEGFGSRAGGTVGGIWSEIFGGNDPMPPSSDDQREQDLLRRACQQHNVPPELMARLVDLEDEFRHLLRRHGLPEDMREALRQEVAKGAPDGAATDHN